MAESKVVTDPDPVWTVLLERERRDVPCVRCGEPRPWYPFTIAAITAVMAMAQRGAPDIPVPHRSGALRRQLTAIGVDGGSLSIRPLRVAGMSFCEPGEE